MFIDEWFATFYQKLPLGYHNDANFWFGQIFRTHGYYPHERLEFWRPVPDPAEPTEDHSFTIQNHAGRPGLL